MGVIAEEAVRIRADTSGFHSEVSSGVLGAVGKVAAAAGAVFGGIKLGKALFVDPIKSAGDFQQTLNVLKATTDAGGASIADVQKKAMALGADLKLPATSANDAATAMLELGRGGFTMKQSMEAAHGVLLLSAAAQIDNATAATYTADALHAFGMQAKDSGKVVDDFAGAANASTASMSEVAQALQQSGQGFHQLHIPIGEASTAIAELANAGIKGSDAGTSLKTMLQRLNPQTKQAKEAMHDMGVQTFDQNGKFVGLRSVIEQMGPKLRDMTEKQRSTALATIFGSDASRAAGIILQQTGKHWDDMKDKVTKAGQAQKLADAQSKGFNGAMAGLRSTIETLQLQIGLKLLPVLTTFVHFIAENLPAAAAVAGRVISAIGDAVGEMVGAVRAHMDQIRSAFQTGIDSIRAFADFISDNVGNVRQLAIALSIGAAAFVVLSAAVKAYTIVQAALNAVMAANPIGLVIIAIAALVIGLTLLYQRSETARQIMDAAFSAMKIAAQVALDFLSHTVIPNAIIAIRSIVAAVEFVKQHWDQIWNAIGPVVTAAFNAVKTQIQAAITVITQTIDLFKNILEGHWGAAWGNLKTIVMTIITGAFSAIKDFLMIQVLVLQGVGKLVAAGLSAGVHAVIGLLANLGGQLIDSIVGAVRRVLGGARAAAEDVAQSIAAGIKTAPGKLAGLAGDLLGRITAAAGQAAGQAFNAMRQVGFAIADGVISGIGNLASRVASAVGNAAKGAVGGALGLIGANSPSKLYQDTVGKSIGDGVTVGVVTSLNTLGTQMGSKLRDVATQVAGMTKANQDTVVKAVKDWASAAKQAFDTEAGKLKDVLSKQLDAAKARIDAWKASLTPAEVQLKTEQAHKQLADLQNSLNAAWNALRALPQQQADAMATLLAQQRATMDQLVATQHQTLTDASIAQHEYEKGIAANANDPLALGLAQAQQNLVTQRALYDQGQISLDQLLAYQDAFDQASVAAADDTNATKLLQDYNTWQGLATQAATAGSAITTQAAADQAAQLTLQAQFNDQTTQATATKDAALQAMLDNNLQLVAAKERADRDRAAGELNAALVARYNRIDEHFDNVRKNTDAHYDEMARHATTSGHVIGDNLAQALRDTIPNIARAASAVAAELSKYLKTNSPTEAGPMRDLDSWWRGLAPALMQGFDTSGVREMLTAATSPDPSYRGPLGPAYEQAWKRNMNTGRMEQLLEQIAKHTGTTAANPPAPVELHVPGSIGVDASVYRSRR